MADRSSSMHAAVDAAEASVYWIEVHAPSVIVATAVLILLVSRT